MPIRPIDVISMPNRSQEASHVHQTENQKMAHAHEHLGSQFTSMVKQDGQRTVRMDKSENNEYRYKDGKKKQSKEDSEHQEKKEKKSEEEQKNIKIRNFDILI